MIAVRLATGQAFCLVTLPESPLLRPFRTWSDTAPNASVANDPRRKSGIAAWVEFTACSSLRHPGLAHAIIDALALREIGRIVAECAGAEAADGEGRIERKSRLHRGPRLVDPDRGAPGRRRERNARAENCGWPRLPGAAKRPPPRRRRDRAWRCRRKPSKVGIRIARAKAQRFKDMAFGFLGRAR